MNYGYQNEYDFVNLFNNKKINELDKNSRKFLFDLFGDLLDNEAIIKCWKNRMNQKADIFIKCNNYIKNISLKCGNSNSVHHEQVQEFKRYLGNVGIPYKVIDYYMSYHFGYKHNEYGDVDYAISLNSDEYKKLYQDEIDIFNKYINKTKIIIDMIDRFIIRGRNSDYDIDALVSGTIDDYVWILKYDIYDMILDNKRYDFTSPHIACLTIGPKKRNVDRTSKYANERYIVCVRWNFIRENIIKFKENKVETADSRLLHKKTSYC